MKATIYLVRHGESEGNRRQVCLGHTDWDLSERGYEQAEACAEALREVKIDAVYASDLLRAYNTALPHARMRGIEAIPDRELRELAFGEWEGVPLDTIKSECHDEYFIGWKQHFYSYRAPGGESVQEGAARMERELARIAEKHLGGTLLVGSHAAVIRAFFARISGMSEEETNASRFPSNASYSIVEYEGGKFRPLAYSVDDFFSEPTGRDGMPDGPNANNK